MATYPPIWGKSSYLIYPFTHLEGGGDDYPSAYLGAIHLPTKEMAIQQPIYKEMATYPLMCDRMATYLILLEKSSYTIYQPTHLEGGGNAYPSTYLRDCHPPTYLGGDGDLSTCLRKG